jgi:hypothetical protein
VITERWPAAKKYRDAFEAVKQAVIDPLFSGRDHHSPGRPIVALPTMDLPLEHGRFELDNIVTQMCGRNIIGSTTLDPPMAIGTEQVQYQMQRSGSSLDLTTATAGVERHAASGSQVYPARTYDATSGGLVIHDNDAWNIDDVYGMDFSTIAEPFDLTGCSVDMGWMADTFSCK